MRQEEQLLKARFGKKQPFLVPDGYFECFATDIMEQLPERKTVAAKPQSPARLFRLRPALVSAASLLAAVFLVGMYVNRGGQGSSQPVAQVQEGGKASGGYSAIDEAADYVMMDNEDFYAYVSEY